MPDEVVEGTEEITSDLPVADFSQWEDQEAPSVQPETPTEENGKYPGTWSPILNVLPTEFHELIAPELKKWDQGVGSRFEKIRSEEAAKVRQEYAGFERFRQSNIDPARLENAHHLAERIDADPVAFLNDLQEMLKQSGLLKEAEEVQEQIDDLIDPNDPLAKKMTLLEQQNQQFMQALQDAAADQERQQNEYQQQQMLAQAKTEIEAEFASLESKVGPLPQRARLEVVARTQRLLVQGNAGATIEDGYRDMMNLAAQINNARPGANAPRIASASGGNGVPIPQPVSLKTADDRMAAAQAIYDAMQD